MTTRAPSARKIALATLGAASLVAMGALGSGCGLSASTEFINEGPGQPSDRASGVVPDGALGACRMSGSKRPPLVNEELWKDIRVCSDKTPRRFLRLGYGKFDQPDDAPAEKRMQSIMEALRTAPEQPDGNVRMLGLLRTVRQEAKAVEELRARVERSSSRTFSCDYKYLFETMERKYAELSGARCPAMVYDPKVRGELCLFDLAHLEVRWLTGSWDCFAHTGAVGEGSSCYQLCAFDDHCAAQVSCAAADYDLTLCALGMCMPDKVDGFY